MEKDTELQLIQRAREQVEEGFYVNNLRAVVDLFREPTLVARWPAALFVMRTITLGLIYEWDKQPVSWEEADRVRVKLQPLFLRVLDLFAREASAAQICAAMDKVVLAWKELSA